MSDGDFAAKYEVYGKALAEASVVNKEAVFDALGSAGVTRVIADFDGEGDSGQIQNIAAYDGNNLRELPDLTVELREVAWLSAEHRAFSRTLHSAIETLCYDYLAQEHGGWENDDGAYGEFTFEVQQRRVELDFNARFSDSVNSTHTF